MYLYSIYIYKYEKGKLLSRMCSEITRPIFLIFFNERLHQLARFKPIINSIGHRLMKNRVINFLKNQKIPT